MWEGLTLCNSQPLPRFWGGCFNDYRNTPPHEGYSIIKKWVEARFKHTKAAATLRVRTPGLLRSFALWVVSILVYSVGALAESEQPGVSMLRPWHHMAGMLLLCAVCSTLLTLDEARDDCPLHFPEGPPVAPLHGVRLGAVLRGWRLSSR